MGLELLVGAASLAVGLISNASAANDRAQAGAAQRESNAIGTAQAKISSAENRRQLLREERVRRARMMQAATNTGTSGSSGLAGGVSAISTNVDNITSASLGETKANEGINKWNQKAVDLENQARQTLAWGDVFQSGLTTAYNIFNK
jgi:hypothetical protein